jgi:hypothetical protein
LHVWYGRDILYEGISKNEPWMGPELRAVCEDHRSKASIFLTELTKHVKGRNIVLGIELLNEPVPSYNNHVTNVLYNAVRSADPDRVVVRCYGVDSSDPAQHNWTQIIYSFHNYDFGHNASGTLEAIRVRTMENYNLPYQMGESHLHDPKEWSLVYPTLKAKGIGFGLWSYKSINMNNWALVNYGPELRVDWSVETFEEIKAKWERYLPNLNLPERKSEWGNTPFIY